MVATYSGSGRNDSASFWREFSRAHMEEITQSASVAELLEEISEANRANMRAITGRASAIASAVDLASTFNNLHRENTRDLTRRASAESSLASTFENWQREYLRNLTEPGFRRASTTGMGRVRLPSRTDSELAIVKRRLKQALDTIQSQEAELEAKQVEVDCANVERDNAIAERDKERREKALIEKFASDVLEISESLERENKELKKKMSAGAWICNSYA